jgi:hypothetical protein
MTSLPKSGLTSTRCPLLRPLVGILSRVVSKEKCVCSCVWSIDGLLSSTNSSVLFSVTPVSSSAMRNRASSLHSSQSCSSFARWSRRTTWSPVGLNSSKVWRTSRYPPAVFKLPFCSDSSKSSSGGGKFENSVRQDRTSVFRVHCTTMSRYCGNELRKDNTLGNNACSGGGCVSTSSSSISCNKISKACGKYCSCW